MQNHTRKELVIALKSLAERLGRSPVEFETLRRKDVPGPEAYRHEFGSWEDALEAAGLDPPDSRRSRYTSRDLLGRLRRLADELGRTPTVDDMRAVEGAPAPVVYRKRFGSWERALAAASQGHSKAAVRRYSNNELLEFLRTAFDRFGRMPKREEFGALEGFPSPALYAKRFGSWGKAVRAAGLVPVRRRYTDDELVTIMKDLGRELGRKPRLEDLRARSDLPDPCTYQERFGTWSRALERAGFGQGPRRYTKDELIERLREAGKVLGRMPKREEFGRLEGFPCPAVYTKYFGSWNKALRTAGFRPRRCRYSDDQLLKLLAKAAKKLGRTPRLSDVEGMDGYPHPQIYRNRFGSFRAAVQRAGLEPRTAEWSELTDEEALELLRRAAERIDRSPTQKDLLDRGGSPPPCFYATRFGSWNAALGKAGLTPRRRARYTSDDLVEYLKKAAKKLGRSPKMKDIREMEGFPHPAVISRAFGSWRQAVLAAGLEPIEWRYSDDELVSALKQLAGELGRTPLSTELTSRKDMPDRHVYLTRFGSWEAALELAGLSPGKVTYSRDDLLRHLRELYDELGHSPSSPEMLAAKGRPSPAVFIRQFGSWNAALSEAGLGPTGWHRYTEEELLGHLRELGKELGRTPTTTDMKRAKDRPSITAYQHAFGSWTAALERCGFQPHVISYSREDLVRHIHELAAELGRTPLYREMRSARGRPSCETYVKHFGTWPNALLAAGLIARKRGPSLIGKWEQRVIAALDAGPRMIDEIARDENMRERTVRNAVSALCKRGIVREVKSKRKGGHVRYDTVDEKLNEILEREHKVFKAAKKEKSPEEIRSNRIQRIIEERHRKRGAGERKT